MEVLLLLRMRILFSAAALHQLVRHGTCTPRRPPYPVIIRPEGLAGVLVGVIAQAHSETKGSGFSRGGSTRTFTIKRSPIRPLSLYLSLLKRIIRILILSHTPALILFSHNLWYLESFFVYDDDGDRLYMGSKIFSAFVYHTSSLPLTYPLSYYIEELITA